MAKCCGAQPCNCRVVAGTGTTVTGNGSAANPYTISADGTTAVAVSDSTTVDLELTGTGAASDPYTVTAAVVLDPTPPAGGTNLIQSGPEGLFVECADVRTCFTGGDGIAYDDTTGEIAARPSTDAGNAVTFGTDGGLYAPTRGGGGATVVQAGDTPTANNTVSGTGTAGDPYVVSTDVIVDPAPPAGGSNLLQSGPDGLYVECTDVHGCFAAGDGIDYDPATGEIAAAISADAGNVTTIGTDGGIYTPAPAATVVQAGDTTTVNATVSGTGTAADPYIVSADAIVAPEPNGLEATANGLLVAPSADAGNTLALGGDGRLYVPPAPLPEVGCGLTGDGTAADPIAVVPKAGQAQWSDAWGCDAATHSTLQCDPSDGELWTPPEHYSAAESIYVEHFVGGWATPLGVGGWRIISAGANFQFNFPANFLGNDCRQWSYDACVAATWDINYTATAVFELGYIYSWGGGAGITRPLWGLLTAPGTARRERDNGTWHEYGFNMPPGAAHSLVGWPAVRVVAGSLTVNSWITDAAYHTTTQNN